MALSDELIARRERVVCPGVGRLSNMTAASALGAIITDADGREYIDFVGGIGTMNIGHSDPAVVAAIQDQATKLIHPSIHVTTYEPYVELCEKLVELFPHGETTKAMLVNSGAEAVENSIKIARQATGRDAIICFTGGFHGRTLMASTLTSKVSYKVGCGTLMPDVYRLPYPVVRPQTGVTAENVSACELARLKAAFQDTVSATDVAAIIIELVQGEGGFNVAPVPYVRGLREICDEHGIMLIIDEVQTGFARTGRWAAYEHYGVLPDLSPWAKSMGGGLPISCVIGKGEVMDRVTPGTLGGTYGGNPVACAASLATLRRMEELDLNARGEHIGSIIRERFNSLAERVPEIADVRGLGAMMAIEFCEAGDPSRPSKQIATRIIDQCRDDGLLLIPAGIEGNVVRILSPLVITDEQLRRGLDIFENAVLSVVSTAAAATA